MSHCHTITVTLSCLANFWTRLSCDAIRHDFRCSNTSSISCETAPAVFLPARNEKGTYVYSTHATNGLLQSSLLDQVVTYSLSLAQTGRGIKFQPRPLTTSSANVSHSFYSHNDQNPNRCRIDMLRTSRQTSPSPNTVVQSRLSQALIQFVSLERVCSVWVSRLQPIHSLEASSFYFDPTQRSITNTHPLCSNTLRFSSSLEPRRSLYQSFALSPCSRNNLSWPSLCHLPWTALRLFYIAEESLKLRQLFDQPTWNHLLTRFIRSSRDPPGGQLADAIHHLGHRNEGENDENDITIKDNPGWCQQLTRTHRYFNPQIVQCKKGFNHTMVAYQLLLIDAMSLKISTS